MFHNYLIFLFAIFGTVICHHVWDSDITKCPMPEDIYPCFCDDDDGYVLVQCNHLTKEEELRSGLSGLKGHKVWKLSLFGDKLGSIDTTLFNGLKIERLDLENTTITLEPPQMQGLERSLNSLHIRACYDKDRTMSRWSLKHLNHLREITLDNNVIPTLKNNWITSSPSSLRSMTIENNGIEEMDDRVFSEMKWLTFLFLERNRLKRLRRSMFSRPAPNLRTLNLNDNEISDLPYDIFEDMPSLRGVDLESNRLTTLDETVWRPVIKQLTRLNVEGNSIVCDGKMKWILSHRQTLNHIDGTCHGPKKLQNKSLRDLAMEDFE